MTTLTDTRTATATEVRAYYKQDCHAVRISRDGHIEFKRNGDDPWLEGRWVSEYAVDPEHGVFIR